ncbi:MAG: prepilin-type N-terminal cleavage/methylation domain-containing protein [Planctomycetota bacterium]|nr:prepilin-type N-terminal cleavage/methylation domain-containing protein [Planctomycetota bacterium]
MSRRSLARFPAHRRGFTLAELLVGLLVVSVLAALAGVWTSRTRSMGSLGVTMANLRQFGAWNLSYAADHNDVFGTFSWKANVEQSTQYPDLRGPFANGQDAAGAQAIDIIRRLAGESVSSTPRPSNWIPHILYQHLVLLDHAGERLPSFSAISPEDANRLDWANDPAGFRRGVFGPRQPSPDGVNWRWIFSSSYETSLSFCQSGDATGVSQSSTHNTYTFQSGTVDFIQRRLSEVAFASRKAHMWDTYQRHLGARVAYFASDEARVPVLFVDGHVAVRATTDANRGWNPTTPTSPAVTSFVYQPASWEPPVPPPGGSATYAGRYRWTRRGINGRDFDGPEVQ